MQNYANALKNGHLEIKTVERAGGINNAAGRGTFGSYEWVTLLLLFTAEK